MRRPVDTRPRAAALLGSLLLLAAACGTTSGTADRAGAASPGTSPAERAPAVPSGPHVVATTSILGDLVGQLVNDDGTVEVLIPPGVDPHAFQASAVQAQALRSADLVVANGLGLEENLLDVLAAAETDGARILRVAEHVEPIPFGEHGEEGEAHDEHAHPQPDATSSPGQEPHGDEDEDEDEDEDDDHAHGALDPHFWQDPVRTAEAVRVIAAAIAEVDGGVDGAEWARRADDYAGEILSVHAEVEELLAAIPPQRRRLVTNHDSMGYFAARYGFEVVGTVVPGSSTQVEANPAAFAELVERIRELGVPAIFAEVMDSDRLARALAQEVGRDVRIVTLFTDALGEPGSGAETYLDLLRTNALRIAEALT